MAKELCIWSYLYENLRIIEGKPVDNKFLNTKMNPRIIETANSKTMNSEGSLYMITDSGWGQNLEFSIAN